ncbi:MAG: flippase-like domain-containing protein [Deltaproteobacteria bacterium]|nr:flippase-like domain-containing protein [Deltaproteobacteria bacterium]
MIDSPEKPSRVGRVVRALVGVVFTGFVVWLVAARLTVETLVQTVERVDWTPALAALAAYVAVVLVRAARFAVAGARAPFATLCCIAAVHAALLRVMPLRSGELAYGVLLERSGGGGAGAGLASIAMLRILDLATVLPAAAAIVALGPVGWSTEWAGPVLVIAGVAMVAVFFALGPISRGLARRFSSGADQQRRGLLARTVSALAETYDLPLARRLGLLALTVSMWALVLAWFHLTLWAIGLTPSAIEGASVGVLGVVGSVLPVSLIGSFGPMEGGFSLGLVALGRPETAAVADSIVASALTFLANWIIALPAWAVLIVRRRG